LGGSRPCSVFPRTRLSWQKGDGRKWRKRAQAVTNRGPYAMSFSARDSSSSSTYVSTNLRELAARGRPLSTTHLTTSRATSSETSGDYRETAEEDTAFRVQVGNGSRISRLVARNFARLPVLSIWTGQSPQPPSPKLARPSPVRGAFLLGACAGSSRHRTSLLRPVL
jgi:hypothetical protein